MPACCSVLLSHVLHNSDAKPSENKGMQVSPWIYRLGPCLGVAVILTIAGSGCYPSTRSYPITAVRTIQLNHYEPIDIKQNDLEQGLRQMLLQLDRDHGPIDIETVVRQYSPAIRRGLYISGYASVQKLSFNGTMVDLDVFFRTDQTIPALYIDVYLQSQATPTYRIANPYYRTSAPQQPEQSVQHAHERRTHPY